MRTPLTRATMDGRGCQAPGCAHTAHEGLVLKSRCHPRAGMKVTYRGSDGVLEVECHQCGMRTAEVQVAP